MAEYPNFDNMFHVDPKNPGLNVNAQMRAWFDANLQGETAQPTKTINIVGDSISPDTGSILVDTEDGASSDNLVTIAIDGTNDGMSLYLRAADEDRTVLVKNNPGMLYGISLSGGADVTLSPTYTLHLKREGTLWREVLSGSVKSSPPPPLATTTTPGIVLPDNKTTFVDAAGVLSAAGAPLLSISWELCTAPLPGKLNSSLDNGLLPRSAWTDAWAEIQSTRADFLVDDAAWLAEVAAQGSCAKFSKGDGSTTFRVPLLRKVAPCAPDPVAGIAAGTYLPDQFQGHSFGEAGAASGQYDQTQAWHNTLGNTPASYSGLVISSSGSPDARFTKLAYTPDQYGNGIPRVGKETRGKRAVLTPYMQMYGAVTNAGALDIAVLVQWLSAKLDTLRYEQEASARVRAHATISSTGVILGAMGVAACTIGPQTNFYRVTLANPAPNLNYRVIATCGASAYTGIFAQDISGISTTPARSTTQFTIKTSTSAADTPNAFSVLVLY